MKLAHHLVVSLVLVLVSLPLFGSASYFIMIGGFLVDIDHYFRFILVNKDLSLINAYRYHKKVHRTSFPKLQVFHTIEFLIFIAILGFFNTIILLVAFGLSIHILLDIFHGFKRNKLHHREWSIINYCLKKLSKQDL